VSLHVCISFTVDAAANLCSWLVPQPVGPTALHCNIWLLVYLPAEPGDRAGYGVVLRPLACGDCGLESRQGHGCISLVSVVCCQVELLRRADYSYRGVLPRAVCLSVIVKSR